MTLTKAFFFFLRPDRYRVEIDEFVKTEPSGWMLLMHPDFLADTTLAKKIRQYGYFGYAANEALFLSEREEKILEGLTDHIRQEFQAFTDRFSQQIIVAEVEALLVG